MTPNSAADETAPVYALGNVDAPVVRAWHPLVSIRYVIDDGGVPILVRERDLASSRGTMTVDELHALAMTNLRTRAAQVRTQPYGDATTIVFDAAFEASLLLIDELWDDILSEHVEGEVVVTAPRHDVLAFTSARSQTGLEELRRLVRRHHPGGDHLLVEELFVRRDGAWDVFEE